MRRLFVSLPMSGKKKDEIRDNMQKAYEKVKKIYPYEEVI